MRGPQHYARTMHLRQAFSRLHSRRRALRFWPWVAVMGALMVVLHGDLWGYTLGALVGVSALMRVAWVVWPRA